MLLAKTQCFEWFKEFISGNFDVRNEDRGKPAKKFEDLDEKSVIYYKLPKPGETVNTNRYQQQMINLNRALQEKRPDYRRRQHKVILHHDNAPSHTAKRVKETIETFSWGNTGACRLFSRLGSVGLHSVRITGPRSR